MIITLLAVALTFLLGDPMENVKNMIEWTELALIW